MFVNSNFVICMIFMQISMNMFFLRNNTFNDTQVIFVQSSVMKKYGQLLKSGERSACCNDSAGVFIQTVADRRPESMEIFFFQRTDI